MLCIAGKNDIAVNILKHSIQLLDTENIVVCPVKNDTGIDSWQKSLIREANNNNIKIVSLSELYEIKDLILLSLEYDKIVKVDNFKSSNLYNIHFSLLPKYRGMYTSALPILNNEKISGVTLHYMDSGIDTGDIIDQISFNISFTDTSRDLYFKYIKYGTMLAKSNLNNLMSGNLSSYVQNKYEASYFSKHSIDYNNIKIDLNQMAINVYNQIRAFCFEEYQIPTVHGKKIYKCIITEEKSFGKSGDIVESNKSYLKISTLDYNVVLFVYKNIGPAENLV